MGWQIIQHSFVLLFRNLTDALKVSVGPIMLVAIFAFAIIAALGASAEDLIAVAQGGTPSSALSLAILILLLGFVFVSAWIAVAWHRLILLEEYPGILPAIAGRPIWSYAGRSVLIGFLTLLAMIPAAILIGLASEMLGPGQPIVGLLAGFLLGTFLSFIWLRLAIVLPATALGRPLTISAAWAATAPLSNAILTASAILVGLNVGVAVITGAIFQGPVGVFVDIIVNWTTLMVGTSILTTLYGVVVEKRTL
jgi:hypothetical protein